MDALMGISPRTESDAARDIYGRTEYMRFLSNECSRECHPRKCLFALRNNLSITVAVTFGIWYATFN